MNSTFYYFWELVKNHGSVADFYMQDCEKLWNTLNIEQQRQLYRTIRDKLRKGCFVHFNPLMAMKDNLRRCKPARAEPVNLNGTARGGRMLENGTAFIACYNGQYGLYSLQDIDDFHMQIKIDI